MRIAGNEDVRWNGEEGLAARTRNHANPRIGIWGIGNTVLEVPVISGVGELAEGVVRRHSVSTCVAASVVAEVDEKEEKNLPQRLTVMPSSEMKLASVGKFAP